MALKLVDKEEANVICFNMSANLTDKNSRLKQAGVTAIVAVIDKALPYELEQRLKALVC